MKQFDLIIPCYNEEATLRMLITQKIVPLRKSCGKRFELDLRLIIVDDASKDNSLNIAKELAEEFSWIKVLSHSVNRGKGAALRTGLENSTGDYVGIQDADDEYNPMNYLELLEPMVASKADVVYGSRYLQRTTRRVLSFWHTLMNRFLTFVSNMFTGLDITDMETCYKLFTKKAAHELALKLKENRFGFEPEITSYVAQGGYKVYETAIEYNPRTYEEGKKITYKDGIRALYCILHYGAPYAPFPMQVLLYTFIGGVSAILNIISFLILMTLSSSLLLSVSLAFILAAMLNYWLCIAILFKHKAFWSGKEELFMYILTLLIMGVLDYALTYSFIFVGCSSGWAKLISIIISFAGNFLLRKYLVFPLKK